MLADMPAHVLVDLIELRSMVSIMSSTPPLAIGRLCDSR